MSSDPAIRVDSLGKCYDLYERPIDRLRQFLWRGRRTFQNRLPRTIRLLEVGKIISFESVLVTH